MDMSKILNRKVQLVMWLVALVLGLRVLFVLVGIDGGGGFDGWVFDTSAVMLNPFRILFDVSEPTTGAGTIDFAALFAGAVYGVLGLCAASQIDKLTSKKK